MSSFISVHLVLRLTPVRSPDTHRLITSVGVHKFPRTIRRNAQPVIKSLVCLPYHWNGILCPKHKAVDQAFHRWPVKASKCLSGPTKQRQGSHPRTLAVLDTDVFKM